jgi:hypothetical protein
VIFRSKGKPRSSLLEDNYPQPALLAEATTPWQVAFQSDEIGQGLEDPVTFNRLEDWTTNGDEHIRYFSGTAVYKTVISVKETPVGNTIFIDFGKVNVMAKVKVNGQYAGGVWTAPYRVDVTKYIQQGDNAIEVEVVNTWVNRLIGDQQLPEKERRTWSHVNPWKKDSPLQPSGLEGPVRLVLMAF